MMITLPEFLKEMGDQRAADHLGVSPRTVGAWRRRERVPRPAVAELIVRLAGGRLELEGIYRPDAQPARRKRGRK